MPRWWRLPGAASLPNRSDLSNAPSVPAFAPWLRHRLARTSKHRQVLRLRFVHSFNGSFLLTQFSYTTCQFPAAKAVSVLTLFLVSCFDFAAACPVNLPNAVRGWMGDKRWSRRVLQSQHQLCLPPVLRIRRGCQQPLLVFLPLAL